MSEQRRGLGDACVLAVPTEYAGPSSGSGDHPEKYFLQYRWSFKIFDDSSATLAPWSERSTKINSAGSRFDFARKPRSQIRIDFKLR